MCSCVDDAGQSGKSMSNKQGNKFRIACRDGRTPEAERLLGQDFDVLRYKHPEYGMCLADMRAPFMRDVEMH